MNSVTDSPPRAPPIKYNAHHGTRWEKEKAAAGHGAFDHPEDAKYVGPWILGETVGKGASGRVKIAKHRQTGQLAAVKILPLQPLVNSRASLATLQAKSDKQRLGIDREITMMKLMNHPNIMRIYDVYEGEKDLYLVLEYVEGGELFDYLVNRGRLHSLEALAYFKQIIYGLNYAHAFSIIHRDLKPENILIHTLDPPLIKIADWGMAAFAPPQLQLETSCGSPHYASPEIVNGSKYEGNATDIWSCGVILYALLTGRLPFDDKDVRQLLLKVKVGRYEMPGSIDPVAKDLLQRMLVVDVTRRITIPEILEHPWLQLQTPGILYVPAPPISHLARPLRSSAHIDRDLLASLIVIWGRTANREEIKADLLSEPGSGTLAKAFYFLLQVYREQTLRENGIFIAEDGEEGETVTKQYTMPATSNFLGVNSATLRIKMRSDRDAPAPPQSQPTSRSRDPSPSAALAPRVTRARPTSAPMPNYAQYHNSRQQQQQAGKDDNGGGNDILTRAPRRSSAMPSGGGGRASTTIAPRPHVFRTREQTRSVFQPMSASMQCDSSPVASPRVSNARFPVMSSRYSAGPAVALHAIHAQPQSQTHTQTQTAPSAMSICEPPQPLSLLRAPRIANQEFQRTIDDLTDKVNVLVAHGRMNRESQSQSQNQNQNQGGNGRVGPNKGRDHDKENYHKENFKERGNKGKGNTEEFVYVHSSGPSMANSPRGRPHSQQPHAKEQEPVHEYSPANFVLLPEANVSEEQHGGRWDDSKEKGKGERGVPMTGGLFARRGGEQGKGKRSRALTIDLPGNQLRRFAHNSPTTPGSPVALTSPSPAVGEFKGWFSNLFNWKAQQTCVICSINDVVATRNETTRLLELMGVVVALEDGGQLRCRLDDGVDPVQKYARFRVELHSPPGSSQNLSGGGALTVVSSQKNAGEGSQCVIVLTQEKGAVSTFRNICGRLREGWMLDVLQSPSPMVSPGVQRLHGETGKQVV